MASVTSPQSASTSRQKAPLSTTHPFTCNTCQVAFRSHDAQRTHYHTDWHQYNLKRKIASLAPLSSETFAEKVLNAQAHTRLERERATFERTCTACNKTYNSENGYANHVGSHKHRQNVATMQMNALRAGGSAKTITGVARKQDDKDETESVVSSTFSLGEPVGEKVVHEKSETALLQGVEALNVSGDSTPTQSAAAATQDERNEKEGSFEDPALPLETCLFCPYLSPSLTLNVSHMTKAHGLFIPEAQYLVDLPGLITYLGRKLVYGNQCLYCNKQKGGLEGIRTHMQDKGHTMLGFETEEQQIELGQYYDFRSTYSDAGEESSDSDDVEKGEGEVVEGGEDEDGEGWETDSDTSIDSTELGPVPIDRVRGARRGEPLSHHMADGWHSRAHGHIYYDEYELHTPTGRAIGHRSLARYYRQNLRDHPLPPPRRAVEYRPLSEEEANGELTLNRRQRREEARAVVRRTEAGMLGATGSQFRDVTKMNKLSQAQENRGRRKFEHQVNKKANSQKHFRDPLLQ